MRFLVTGGAGFIGRWVVKRLLTGGWKHFGFSSQKVVVVDNLSNGRRSNIDTLLDHPDFEAFYPNDILDSEFMDRLFLEYQFDFVIHLAACINVQRSIDNPKKVFDSDVLGTMNILENIRGKKIPILFMSTCMVYDVASATGAISENHGTRCASPYAGAKLSAEKMVESYHLAYGMPAIILRPFNTYGPYQKTNGEGGVVAIFIERELEGGNLSIYGDGSQTRDLLYVEDCAEFILRAAFSGRLDGKVYNAGSGSDVTVNDLAGMICNDKSRIRHLPHIHPQSEIQKLVCDNKTAKTVFNWRPRVSLEKGIELTKKHIIKSKEFPVPVDEAGRGAFDQYARP